MPNTTTNTSNRAYPLPTAGNDLAYDVAKIITALTAIDADVATAFAQIAAKAGLASPAFSGTPTAPTAAPGTNTGQLATTAFVAATVNALVNSSPGALDTLNELAAALGNDPNFATTVTNALAGKLSSSALDTDATLSANADNKVASQKATKAYVDALKGSVADPWSTLAKLAAGVLRKVNQNDIINGDFDIWQRGTSQTTSGYGSDDRWLNGHVGSTKTHSQQAFANGQTDVPGNPKFFSRTVVTSSAGTTNYVNKAQAIEGVQRNAGRDVTVTFWAKADATRNIALELKQNFGTGGSPSSATTGIGAQIVALTTVWQKFTRKISIPSIAGKTIGTNADDNLALFFWFDAGSSFNSRTASLGQQSGTFDIAHVSVVAGDATGEDDPSPLRSPQQEITASQRFYETGFAASSGARTAVTAGANYNMKDVRFSARKRATPNVTLSGLTYTQASAGTVVVLSVDEFSIYVTASFANSNIQITAGTWTAEAELTP